MVLPTQWQDILPVVHKYQQFLDPIAAVRGEFDLWKRKWLIQRDKSKIIKTATDALGNCGKAMNPGVAISPRAPQQLYVRAPIGTELN